MAMKHLYSKQFEGFTPEWPGGGEGHGGDDFSALMCLCVYLSQGWVDIVPLVLFPSKVIG